MLHYGVGEKYEAHYDYFHDKINTQFGGNRMATVLMYLADTEEGGETTFPYAEGFDPEVLKGDFSSCAKGKLAVKPKKGSAILFWDMTPEAVVDHYSLHEACPVIKGHKWSATKWMHVKPLGIAMKHDRKQGCKDLLNECQEWAASGECTKNPDFMIGTKDGSNGQCRASCKACSSIQLPL